MRKIKCNDEVIVITGKDKGKHGKVVKVLSNSCLIVNGVQMIKKHQKPNPQLGQPGGIIQREAPINISNVAIFNKTTEKADRIGFKVLEDGKKIRIFKSNGEAVDAS
jgi:large subunit ribosomal protein L24